MTQISADVFVGRNSLIKPVTRQKTCIYIDCSVLPSEIGMHDNAYIGGHSENNIKCVVHDDLGLKNQTTRYWYILPRHWLYKWFSQFHSCGTYSVLSRSPSNVTTNKPTPSLFAGCMPLKFCYRFILISVRKKHCSRRCCNFPGGLSRTGPYLHMADIIRLCVSGNPAYVKSGKNLGATQNSGTPWRLTCYWWACSSPQTGVYDVEWCITLPYIVYPYSAGASYDNFVEDLKEAEDLRQCRYGIYDAQYTLKDGQNRNKIVFFLWYAALLSFCWLLCIELIVVDQDRHRRFNIA